MQRGPEGHHLVDSGQGTKLLGQGVDVRPRDLEGREGLPGHDFGRRARGQQVAVGDIRQTGAALGLVHVVRGDERGDALGRELVHLVPEVAASHGVHARGGLVQQQESRLVQHARRQGESLLPAARERPGQLPGEAPELHALDGSGHDRLAVVHAVDAGDEVQVLAHAQILVEAEALGHVAHRGLDALGVAEDVETQAGP